MTKTQLDSTIAILRAERALADAYRNHAAQAASEGDIYAVTLAMREVQASDRRARRLRERASWNMEAH